MPQLVPIEPQVDWYYIQHSWGSAYWITHNILTGGWSARRKDQRGMLTAKSGIELLTAIREDYNRLPVPRLKAVCHCGQDRHNHYGMCEPQVIPRGRLARIAGAYARRISGRKEKTRWQI
jgi:hypothetical protein